MEEKEYGLVLAGGGTRGAYQVGVWKALIELGIKIKGIEREKTIILLTAFIHLFTKFSTGFPHKMWKTVN